MKRRGHWAYVVPLLAAVIICAGVMVDLVTGFTHTRDQQRKLQDCGRLRDGLYDLFHYLNSCERFNSSYLLTKDERYLSEYERAKKLMLNTLYQEQRLGVRLLPGDLVMEGLFRSSVRRLQELETRIKAFQSMDTQSGSQFVLSRGPTQPMARFRANLDTLNSTLRLMDQEIWRSLVGTLQRRGVLMLGGGILAALLVALAFFQLNLTLAHSHRLLGDVRLAEHRYHLLAGRVQEQREEERGKLARQVHDELGQTLTAAKIDLTMALRTMDGDKDAVVQRIRSAMASLDGAVLDVRRLSTELRPGILDQMGLEPTLEWLLKDFGRRTGLVVHFKCAEEVALGQKADIVVFRIVQEALTNIARHAQSTEVSLLGVIQDGRFLLAVADDGVGFEQKRLSDPHSIGLFGMRDRAAAVGGNVEFFNGPEKGAVVRIDIPVPEKAQDGLEAVSA